MSGAQTSLPEGACKASAIAPVDVSAVVVNPNGGYRALRTVAALVAKRYPLSLVVVVDNASSDGSLGLTSAAFPEVRIINLGGNRGLSVARNEGLRAVSSPLVLLLDHDIYVEESVVAAMVDAWQAERHHLTRYIENFARAQIAIHLFDDFRREPLPILKQTLDFVEVDPAAVELDTRVQNNRSGLPRSRALYLLTREHPLKERIKASLPLWARLQVVKLGTRINRINIVEQPLPEEARLEGIKLFRDNVLRLQDVLGCDLSAWLR